MIDFDYVKAHDVSDAIKQIAGHRRPDSSPAAPISST